MGVRPHAEMPAIFRRTSRVAFLGLGLLCTGLGIVGLVLPLMPGTIFLIVAAWAFSKSSPRLESWLIEHPLFGKTLKNWMESRSLSLRAKVLSVTVIWAGLLFSMYALRNSERAVGMAIGLALVGGWLTWFLLSRKTSR